MTHIRSAVADFLHDLSVAVAQLHGPHPCPCCGMPLGKGWHCLDGCGRRWQPVVRDGGRIEWEETGRKGRGRG